MLLEKKSLVRRAFSTKGRVERKGTFRQSARWECMIASSRQHNENRDDECRGRWKRLRHSESFLKAESFLCKRSKRCSETENNLTCSPYSAGPNSSPSYENANNFNSELSKDNNNLTFSDDGGKQKTEIAFCDNVGGCGALNSTEVNSNKRKSVAFTESSRNGSFPYPCSAKVADNNSVSSTQHLTGNCAAVTTSSWDSFVSKLWPTASVKYKLKVGQDVAVTPKKRRAKCDLLHLGTKSPCVSQLVFSKTLSPEYNFLRQHTNRVSKSLTSSKLFRAKSRKSVRKADLFHLESNNKSLAVPKKEFPGLHPGEAIISHKCKPVLERIGQSMTSGLLDRTINAGSASQLRPANETAVGEPLTFSCSSERVASSLQTSAAPQKSSKDVSFLCDCCSSGASGCGESRSFCTAHRTSVLSDNIFCSGVTGTKMETNFCVPPMSTCCTLKSVVDDTENKCKELKFTSLTREIGPRPQQLCSYPFKKWNKESADNAINELTCSKNLFPPAHLCGKPNIFGNSGTHEQDLQTANYDLKYFASVRVESVAVTSSVSFRIIDEHDLTCPISSTIT